MRWEGYIACMGKNRVVYSVLVGNLRERDHLEDPGVDGRAILRGIFTKWDMDWIELSGVRDGWRARVNAVMNLRVP
jgi:hypothetical protein